MIGRYWKKFLRFVYLLTHRGALGSVDHVGPGGIYGWAIALPGRGRAEVQLAIDGEVVSTAIADRFRPDIRRLFGGSGRHGYRLPVPGPWRDGMPHEIAVLAGPAGISLAAAPHLPRHTILGHPPADPAHFPDRIEDFLRGSRLAAGCGSRISSTIALFACHSADGRLGPSQENILRALESQGCRTIVCQSSLHNADEFIVRVQPLCSDVLVRKEGGRDFASWNILIDRFRPDVEAAEVVVLINDSFLCVAPDLAPLFRSFEASGADVFAITESRQQFHHLQSSAILLSRTATNSRQFREFVETYPFPLERDAVVASGELGFSQAIAGSDLVWATMLSPERGTESWLLRAKGLGTSKAERDVLAAFRNSIEDDYDINPQHMFWRQILDDLGLPLLKKELLVSNPAGIHDIADAVTVVEAKYGAVAATKLKNEVAALRKTR